MPVQQSGLGRWQSQDYKRRLSANQSMQGTSYLAVFIHRKYFLIFSVAVLYFFELNVIFGVSYTKSRPHGYLGYHIPSPGRMVIILQNCGQPVAPFTNMV